MIAAYQRISRADGDLGKDGKDKSNSMEALQMLIGGFVIFMIPQVVGGVVVLLELAAVMLR